jgi:hypothetical protein
VRDWRPLSRRCPDPWSDLARLRLATDWTRPSLERNAIANYWRVQRNNAGAAKEEYRAGVVVRLDDTASGFRAVYFNLACFCHKSLLSACGVGCGSRLGPHLFVLASNSGSLIQAGREHRLIGSLIGRSCFRVRIGKRLDYNDVTTGRTMNVPGYGVASYPAKVADVKILVAGRATRRNKQKACELLAMSPRYHDDGESFRLNVQIWKCDPA